MALSAERLSLSLSGIQLLKDVSVEIVPGRVHTVLGPNGAGKTSLLRVLVAELSADSGEVVLNGRPLRQWNAGQRARMLAVLPQHSLLNFPFTGLEVVMLGRTPHDTGAVRDRDIARQALKKVDGDYLCDRLYTHLSGGEKQRVHLARVLAQIWEPAAEGDRFLVLDEPTSSFDLAHQQLTLEIVVDLARQGVGVLMVIHDLNLAARCADQMMLMQHGQLVFAGTPDTVLNAANIYRVFDVNVTIGRHPVAGTPLVIT